MRRISALVLLAVLLAACGGATTAPTAEPTGTPIAPTAQPTGTSMQAPTIGSTQVRATDGMVMVFVPAGGFLRGTSEAQVEEAAADCEALGVDESACRRVFADELPQRSVTLDAFWIDRTEVTNAQYRKCVEAGACAEPGCWDEADLSAGDQPVVCVRWDDAVAYCDWAGARLPTEAEWEKAARGTDGRVYPWGNTFDRTLVNSMGADAGDGYALSAPVGSYPEGSSPYGALDMAGNVWEWVSDWYGDTYYSSSPDRNPQGPASGEYRVERGGSWSDDSDGVRSAFRLRLNPVVRHISDLGFRCGLSSTPSP